MSDTPRTDAEEMTTPTLDAETLIAWLELIKPDMEKKGYIVAGDFMAGNQMCDAILATLRSVKAEPVAWGIRVTVAGQEMWDYIAQTRDEANDHINSWLASDEIKPEAHRLVALYAAPQPVAAPGREG